MWPHIYISGIIISTSSSCISGHGNRNFRRINPCREMPAMVAVRTCNSLHQFTDDLITLWLDGVHRLSKFQAITHYHITLSGHHYTIQANARACSNHSDKGTRDLTVNNNTCFQWFSNSIYEMWRYNTIFNI